jgi:hypothetical protein
MALLASFAVRPFFGGAAVSSLYFSNSAVHFSYAPKKTICLMVGPFGEGRRVAHRLICMVSLVILKCMNLVIQLANDNKVN